MTDPNARPTMADFASELHAWLTPPKALTSPEDISDLAARLAEQHKSKMERDQRADETRKRQIEQARQAVETLVQGINKLFDKLKQSGLSDGQVTITRTQIA
jgi:phosphoglycolate phosphatase-like HAD superfamily hydrolase